jgi:FKBP-type peptidyl-prolyl cis-trans isomerase SlyD
MSQNNNKFISMNYQLYIVEDGEKTLQEQTSEEHPFQFITGFGVALDALEKYVIGIEKGAEFELTIQPEQAFGVYIPEGVHKVGRDVFEVNGKFDDEHIYEGSVITLSDVEGHQFMATVTKVEADGVTVDTNHPLAGKVLLFTGTMLENRDATEAEINQMIKQLTGGGCGGGCHNCHHEQGDEGCEGGCGNGCGHCGE